MAQTPVDPLYLENPTGLDIRRHDLFQDLAEIVAAELIKEHTVPEKKACEIGNALADFIATHWNGQMMYFTADGKYKSNKRDWEIFNKLKRGNAHELAKEYGLSFVRVYQIARRCRSQLQQRAQAKLLDESTLENDQVGGDSDISVRAAIESTQVMQLKNWLRSSA